MDKKDDKTFYKVLAFQRLEKGSKQKFASFVDKDGVVSEVLTEWDGVIPGMRYSCRLKTRWEAVEKGFNGAKRRYIAVHTRMWVDNLEIVSEHGEVNVLLDGKPVEALCYVGHKDPDYESKVEALTEYFAQKTFQLRSENVSGFILQYTNSCKDWYRLSVKDAKREFKKS